MICPVCRAEYVPGRAECSDCRVALVDPASAPDLVVAGDDAVEIASTSDAAVARGWRDALTTAGVGHRIVVSGDADPETPQSFVLHADAPDAEWAAALASVVDEQPSLETDAAIRRGRERMSAGPVTTSESDIALFDVPDLLPPPDVTLQISAAETTRTIGLMLAILFACAAVALSPWWAIPAVIAGTEGVRAQRRARARRAEWQQASGWEPLTQ